MRSRAIDEVCSERGNEVELDGSIGRRAVKERISKRVRLGGSEGRVKVRG